MIRTARESNAVASTLRTLLREQEPSLAFDSIGTMDAQLMTSLARPKAYALLIGALAVFALLIAGVGLFGVLSYMTSQRTREIGISPHDALSFIAVSVVLAAVAAVACAIPARRAARIDPLRALRRSG